MGTARRSDEDHLQRALNDSRRQRLTERFGAHFSPPNPDLPADVEATWLENIERYEEAAQDAEFIKVRDYLGDPVFMHVKLRSFWIF
jgi:hypothetical protein